MTTRNRILLWSALGGVIGMFTVQFHPSSSPIPVPAHPANLLIQNVQLSEALGQSVGARAPASLLATESPMIDLAQRLKLLGTARVPEPRAWIEDRATQQTNPYAEGEMALDARIVLIGSGVVWLERDGIRTQLRLWESSTVADGPDEAAPQHASITLALRGASEAISLMLHRNQKGGFGLLVSSLGARSWLSRLGCREGDLILAINDQTLLSPQQTLQVIRKAVSQPTLTLSIQRDNEPYTLHASDPLS